MEERTNVGYTIIKSQKISNVEVVLGVNQYNNYVTWLYNNNGYFTGHYFNNKEKAMKDYKNRIEKEKEIQEIYTEKPISKETKIIIEWIANMVIEKFQDQIKDLEELESDKITRFGGEKHLISTYEKWISEIAEAVDEVKKA